MPTVVYKSVDFISQIPPITILSLCLGVLLIGIIIFIFIYLNTKNKLYLATLFLALIGLFFVGFECLVIASYYYTDVFWGRQFHRLQSLSICFLIFAIPYFLFNIPVIKNLWRKINKVLVILGLAISLIFLTIAFLYPDLFVSQTQAPNQNVNLSWVEVRGNAGSLFRLRDYLIIPLSIYMLIYLLIDLFQHRSFRYIIFPVIGIILAIVFGYFDYLRLYGTESGFSAYFYSNKYMSYYSIGITLFALFTMIGTVLILVDQLKESQKARNLEAIGLIAAGLAHDFNNMLTVMVANLSEAIKNIEDPWTKELLLDSQRASLSARNLTNQLLTFSKGGALTKNIGSTSTIIKDTAKFILRGSKVDCIFQIEPDIKTADIDAELLTQIIQNLVLNAKQALPDGGVIKIKASNEAKLPAHLKTAEMKSYLKISVYNSGQVISKKVLKNIFEPFYSTKKTGSGLGLFMVNSIVQKHKGFIEIISKEKEGTTFNVYLPVIEKAAEIDKLQKPIKTKKFVPLKILVVDDQLPIRKMLEKFLQKSGHKVSLASSTVEALTLFKQAQTENLPYNLLILDITMPTGGGGLSLVKEIRSLDKTVKIIASSGYSDAEIALHPSAYGFDAFLAKPYSYDDLLELL